jgi:AcrR family transcriptional regulator
MEKDLSTEQKIKDAARKVFTQKGYAATRTRDIAEESGVNLSLLNYYFRSKEKLFDIIMMDNFEMFIQSVMEILNNEKTDFFKKVELLVDHYITMIMKNPDLPIFILGAIRNHAEKFLKKAGSKMMITNTVLSRQWEALVKAKKVKPIDPVHLGLNTISMTIFPFVAAPMIKNRTGMDTKTFNAFMEERKKLIPMWISDMLKVK